ncbi:MAG: PAS domain S-box protein, partial [Chitinophagaceae bacterium]
MKQPTPIESDLSNEARYPSAAQLRQLFHTSLDLICSLDSDGTFVHMSDACHGILGYVPAEMIGQCITHFVHEDDTETLASIGAAIIRGENKTDLENRYRKKDGSYITISWSCHWNERESLIFCIGRNVTEQQERKYLQAEYEKKLKQQNRQMNQMLERITDAFFAIDEDWRIIYVNQQAERVLGIKGSDYLCQNLWEAFPSLIDSECYTQYHKAMEERKPAHFTTFLYGFESWYQISAYPSESGLSVFFRDVSDQVKADKERQFNEAKLQQSNERFRLAAKMDAIYDWDISTNHLLWGEGLEETFGYRSEELQIGQWEAA